MTSLDLMKKTMEKVYGVFSPQWKPKNFAENKSRYLWTDAFGVVNFLTLYSETDDKNYLKQAEILVDSVHDSLGRNRDDPFRRLGSATDENPLLGGLRIGKPFPEGAGMSEDGQYYHYLTKWMFALNRLSLVSGDSKYNKWAVDLARTVHPAFVQFRDGRLKMFWKMSIDLSRPLVNSEGGLDPYDGYTMYKLLSEGSTECDVLEKELSEMSTLVERKYKNYDTNDCLDAGEALWLAHFYPMEQWAKHLLEKAASAVDRLYRNGHFSGHSHYRLAFREFGSTIGVQMHGDLKIQWTERLNSIHSFWLNEQRLFFRDGDISPVMFSSSLLPGHFNRHFPTFNRRI